MEDVAHADVAEVDPVCGMKVLPEKAAASVAHAVANAAGKRLRDLPLTRHKIKDAIDA